MHLYHYQPGNSPILVNIPHAGTHVPEDILERLTPAAKQLADTDWHVDRLYAFAREHGAHVLAATHSRYVIDLNRYPDDTTLYPQQFTTGLCPVTDFNGSPLYTEEVTLTEEEIKTRTQDYWQPYHEKLQSILAELKNQHQRIILLDAHSICSHLPRLFAGQLPDINLGTADGKSADERLTRELMEYARKTPYSIVCNGRFKGGYITRHYGQPDQGIQAIQIELTQKNYMQESYPYRYDEEKASQLQTILRGFFTFMTEYLENSALS